MNDLKSKPNDQAMKKKITLWEWVKAICTVVICITVAIKIFLTDMAINFDFVALLSLILALFSVGLSALFYFKATETSNSFYDNTYKFTKDIAELLIKIESGFGERLKSLDEGYNYIRNKHFSSDSRDVMEEQQNQLEAKKAELAGKEEEFLAKDKEKDIIIQGLIKKSNLDKQTREAVKMELQKKETELEFVRNERNKVMHEIKDQKRRDVSIVNIIKRYTKKNVIPEYFQDMNSNSIDNTEIIERFKKNIHIMDKSYLRDLERHGYLSENGYLTPSGVILIASLLKSDSDYV